MRPHRWQATRLRHPWDSLGKKTGVGCYFLLQFMKVKSESEVAQSCPTLSDPMDCSLPGSMGFSRQEYWSGWPLPSPFLFKKWDILLRTFLLALLLAVKCSSHYLLLLRIAILHVIMFTKHPRLNLKQKKIFFTYPVFGNHETNVHIKLNCNFSSV